MKYYISNMCYLLFAKKLNSDADPETILKIIRYKKEVNKDGFAFKTPSSICRTLDFEKFENRLKSEMKHNSWVGIHLRMASMGSVNINNVHFWEINKHFFAHNGHMFHYKPENDKSDSYQYFEKLANSIKSQDEKHVVKRIKDSHFSGRAILIGPNNEKYLYGDFHFYMARGWLLVSSTELKFKTAERKYGDLTFCKRSQYHEDDEGIFRVMNKGIRKLGSMPKPKIVYRYLDDFDGPDKSPQIGFNFDNGKYYSR